MKQQPQTRSRKWSMVGYTLAKPGEGYPVRRTTNGTTTTAHRRSRSCSRQLSPRSRKTRPVKSPADVRVAGHRRAIVA
jgi:hypothetical protein